MGLFICRQMPLSTLETVVARSLLKMVMCWGVNTSILRNTEAIGFAIPMTTVYKEIGSSLY